MSSDAQTQQRHTLAGLDKSQAAISPLPEAEKLYSGCLEGSAGQLASEFTAYRHFLRQVFRDGPIAIYERSRPGREPHEFELVVIREQKERVLLDGSIIPAREAYPNSENWGTYGWSFPFSQRELVFELGRRMAASPCSYGQWMRHTLSHWKDKGRLPNAGEDAALVAAYPKREPSAA